MDLPHAPSNPPSSSCPSCSSDDQEWEIVPSPSSSPKRFKPAIFEVPRAATPVSSSTMPGWKDEYLTALLEAERSNPVSFDLVEACTHLNDRIATLEAEKAQLEATNAGPSSSQTRSSAPPPPTTTTTTTQDDSLLHARTRADLAHTLTQKTHLEARLRATTHDRDRLLSISKAQQQQLSALTAERDALARKVRDQASELRGKKDLLQQVQDEMLALEMELNSSNAARARLTKENKDLVERWMLRVAGEANAMNSRNERG
ncbi:autophagy protein 16, interacts with Atg12p-Atg5p [Gnomoniopsis smithogilvyi]|uniref:Autophagy protein 16, interacts with Atg12p-Atg5p n=1 Tax=Gnomoniopsis smithogilvyi TaxID=1191159 RepID=A0A9W9CWH7_9PEZI|nr:autophagy protein 16, interacts with Atg12p-Atg5p [Gnomoniopsis smithogilvyi]